MFKHYATNGRGKGAFFCKDDGLKMVEDALLPISEEKTVVAYALSKQTVFNEMGDFDKYN